jgi:hypothetical protein
MFRYQWASANIRDLQMINIINEHWRDGDLLYYTDDGTFVIGSLSWTNIDNAILAKPCGVVYGSLSPLTRSALGMRVDLLPDDYPGRVWIVADETPLTPSCQLHDIRSKGWLNSEPVFCSNDTELVRSCLYLSTP